MRNWKLNERIAEELMMFKRGSYGCVDGTTYTWLGPTGERFKEKDANFPNFAGRVSDAMWILHTLDQYVIEKFSPSLYKVSARAKTNDPLFTSTKSNLPEAICEATLLAHGIVCR